MEKERKPQNEIKKKVLERDKKREEARSIIIRRELATPNRLRPITLATPGMLASRLL